MSLDRAIRNWNHKRIDKMRQFKLWLTNAAFAGFSEFTPSKPDQAILVLRLDGKLGDSVAATGFLRELKIHNPQSRLLVVASVAGADIYRRLIFVDEVFETGKGFLNTIRLYFKLKKNRYKFIINTSHILNPRVVFLTSVLTAARKMTMANSGYKLFSDHVAIDFKKDHITDRYGKILKQLDIQTSQLNYQLHLKPEADEAALKAISEVRTQFPKIVALNSFAGANLRNFNQSTTTEIVKKLLVDPKVAVISLANEGDHRILDRWVDGSLGGRWIHFPHLSHLDHNIALLKNSDLLITPDTAWVHIASALNKKQVAIYRADRNPEELNSVAWAPYKAEGKIIFAISPEGAPDDINNVETDEVARVAVQLLG